MLAPVNRNFAMVGGDQACIPDTSILWKPELDPMLYFSCLPLRQKRLFAALISGALAIGGSGNGLAGETTPGAQDNPVHLTCATLKSALAHKDLAEFPEVEGRVTVNALDFASVPPLLVGCGGKVRVFCVMETSLEGIKPGDEVSVQGRIASWDQQIAVIDPCGASAGRESD